MTRVASRRNPRYREVARLVASSRDRRRSGRCILEGEHLVGVYLDRIGVPDTVVASEDALSRPGVAALVARVPPSCALVVPQALFDDMAALLPGVGIIAIANAPVAQASGAGDLLLVVEAIQDPGNLGSMLRSAAAFGVTEAWLSPECAFAWSPKVLRAGQGAHFQLAIHEDQDLVAVVRSLKRGGTRVLATVATDGKPIDRARIAGRVAIAVGNEGAGLSAPLRAEADEAVTIPMPGGTESLNVAAATAIALYEVARWRTTAAARR
ncbi:MAG: RNA methyltransferase [Betaproteobacteria bacterium]